MAKKAKAAKQAPKATEAKVVRQSLHERAVTRLLAQGYSKEEAEKVAAILTKRTRRTSIPVAVPVTEAGIVIPDATVRQYLPNTPKGPFVLKVRKGAKTGVTFMVTVAKK